ncbi:MAG: aldo/keto reductase, partial [Oscillospiraceae bacterium]|nr:aldo/keto reductase [Oscillospiraceae bacterium]
IMMNRAESLSIDHNQGILNYCRSCDCTVQAWSPFRSAKSELTGSLNDKMYKKMETRPYIGSEEFMSINKKLDEFSEKYSVSAGAISIAFILRHPANMQIVLGSSKPARIRDAMDGLNVNLTREEWYELYLSGGNIVP